MRRTLHLICIALLAGLVATAAVAQSTTATIRGKVTNDHGGGLGNAEINAVNTSSGFVRTIKADANGGFQLAGLAPGEYNIVVAAPAYEAKSETLTVLVGQNLDMNFVLSPTAVVNESITVVGNQLVETKTPEIATNVTPQQIENLPQDDRNFLNFAGMAPGIRLSADPQRKTFAGDAQDPEQTNIFIDGVSTKNDVLLGGTSGQDSSRGNPFPQSAVQEFRVITQNYSAEYDHASSAIITAVTKTGGNEMTGNVFGYYQPKRWVAPTTKNFQYSTLTTNTSYHRVQPGVSVGGPIIKDKLNYFLDYEGDDEHATTPVAISSLYPQFTSNNGTFSSPFKETLFFGKVSWQAASNQVLDTSINYRREHETRDFGGTTTFQSATDLRNWVYGGTVRHQWNNSSALNEASLAFQKYGWNPTPLNPNDVGLNYEGCCRLGGNSTTQQFDQRRIELRDNYNFAPWDMKGTHNLKAGGNIDFMHYRVNKSLFGNPQFDFKSDVNGGFDYSQPYRAEFGFGNPILSTANNEYGIYGQDNWQVNTHLQLNLGLRWDYETHMLDENFVTPANIVAALKGKTFNDAAGHPFQISNEYFSTGSERKPFRNMYQPRLGFSYDLRGDAKSVVFGGWGRYFDRLYLNSTLDERFRLQFPVYNIFFCPKTGTCGAGLIPWNPSYQSVAGLNSLIASGQASPEIHLLSNNTKPPYSNQANIGYRQAFGSWVASASYDVVRGHRGITWVSATGACCAPLAPGYGAVILSDPVGKSFWYSGESFTLDRPYAHGWGARLVYTHAKAEQNGNDLFSLDLPSAADYARHPIPGSEPNHINATGIVGLPWDIRLSTNITVGSGPATDVFDLSQGFDLAGHLKTGVINSAVYPPKSSGFGYRDIDFRLQKEIHTGGRTSVTLIGDVFNATNETNYGCLNNFIPPIGDPNYNNAIATLGQPNCVVSLGRREQIGFKVSF